MSDFLNLQGAKDLNTDAIHISAVANSKDPVTGAAIDTHVNRAGDTDYTLDGLYKALGPVVMPWTSMTGGTLTQPNQAFLHPTDGNYYSWGGAYPVGGYVVAHGTDPTLTGSGYVPRTDVVLRDDLASDNGCEILGFKRSGLANAVSTTLQKRLSTGALWLSDFASEQDADHTQGVQMMFDACQSGGAVHFDFPAKISDEIRISKPVTISGLGNGNSYSWLTPGVSDPSIVSVTQTNTTKSAFVLVATTGNYAFGQYAIHGVNFIDMMLSGPSNTNRAVCAITTDTAVNGGYYHIRSCTFTRVTVRYFSTGIKFQGTAYLNTFSNWYAYYCGKGFESLRGSASSDPGGQTRFSLCQTVGCGTGIDVSADPGSYSVVCSTLSEGDYGIKINEETQLLFAGNEVESNTQAGLMCKIKESNPYSSASKKIIGNKFLTNGADIYINKTTTAFADGNFAWPMNIDANSLLSGQAIKIDLPVGELSMRSKQFVIGASNAGPNGPLFTSQISSAFGGADYRDFDPAYISKKVACEPIVFNGTGGNDINLAGVSVAHGKTLNFIDVLRYSVSAIGARGNASVVVQASTSGIIFNWFGSGKIHNAEWTNTSGSTQTVVIKSNDGGTGDRYYVSAYFYIE